MAFHRPFSPRAYSQTIGLRPRRYACRPWWWSRRRWTQQAKQWLLNFEAAITDVCLEVCCNSLGTFSKTFSELVGLSPHAFRTMPRRLTAKQFAAAVWNYLAARKEISGPAIEGEVMGPARPRGFVFVGTFVKGVPLGVPVSGTVMIGRGKFRIERPPLPEFHLLAALMPFSASLAEMAANLPVSLVASQRVANGPDTSPEKHWLRLRPLRPTDPPSCWRCPPCRRYADTQTV